jgi:hypothetical protein
VQPKTQRLQEEQSGAPHSLTRRRTGTTVAHAGVDSMAIICEVQARNIHAGTADTPLLKAPLWTRRGGQGWAWVPAQGVGGGGGRGTYTMQRMRSSYGDVHSSTSADALQPARK